jgi:hypothetical protein
MNSSGMHGGRVEREAILGATTETTRRRAAAPRSTDALIRCRRIATPIGLALLTALASGCSGGEGRAAELAPPLRPISAEAKTRAKDPRFDEFRALLRVHFESVKRTNEFHKRVSSGGSVVPTAEERAQHDQLRHESDELSEKCAAYVRDHLADEPPDVIQSLYDEELAKAMPPE